MTETDSTAAFVVPARAVRLRRDPDGHVVLHRDGRDQRVGRITAAFPLSRPDRLLSVRDADGKEICLLDGLGDLDDESLRIVREEQERSYFMPQITDVRRIHEEMRVAEWTVVTNKGPRVFHVRSVRQNVRRIGARRFVVKDVDGNRYEIPDWMRLRAAAQKLLEPYL